MSATFCVQFCAQSVELVPVRVITNSRSFCYIMIRCACTTDVRQLSTRLPKDIGRQKQMRIHARGNVQPSERNDNVHGLMDAQLQMCVSRIPMQYYGFGEKTYFSWQKGEMHQYFLEAILFFSAGRRCPKLNLNKLTTLLYPSRARHDRKRCKRENIAAYAIPMYLILCSKQCAPPLTDAKRPHGLRPHRSSNKLAIIEKEAGGDVTRRRKITSGMQNYLY